MAIQVTYRRTRRLSMRIVKNGDVHVSAPIGMPKKEVERFIDEHRDWIAEALMDKFFPRWKEARKETRQICKMEEDEDE